MDEKKFKLGGKYDVVCKTDFASPAFQKNNCEVEKDGKFRALFEYEVDMGEVKKADATMSREVFDELTPSSDSEQQVQDVIKFMDSRNKDRVTLTVLEPEGQKAKVKGIFARAAEKL